MNQQIDLEKAQNIYQKLPDELKIHPFVAIDIDSEEYLVGETAQVRKELAKKYPTKYIYLRENTK